MEAEAHADVLRGGEGRRRGAVGDELEDHGGGVVGHAVEVGRYGEEAREAEEGGEGAVGAELDVEFRGGLWGRDGRVEGLQDLGGEGGALDGAHGGGGVVGEVPFVVVGEGAGLGEGGWGEEVGGVEVGGVVDGGDVEEVED